MFRLGDVPLWPVSDEIDLEIRRTSSRNFETSSSNLLKSEEPLDLSVIAISELNWYYIELDSDVIRILLQTLTAAATVKKFNDRFKNFALLPLVRR